MPHDWKGSNLNTNDRLDSSSIHGGTYSFKITPESALKHKYLLQKINLSGQAKDTISFSVWNKTNATFVRNPANINAYVQIAYTDGTKGYINLLTTPSLHDWENKQGSLTVKKPYSSLTVYFHNYTINTTVWFDDVTLTVNSSSPLLNPGVDINADLPQSWTSANLSYSDKLDSTTKRSGNYSFKITPSSPLKSKYIYQKYLVSGAASDTINFFNWNKTDATPQTGQYTRGYIRIDYTDGTYGYIVSRNSANPHDWEMKSGNLKVTKPYSSIVIVLQNYSATTTVWFDDINLSIKSANGTTKKLQPVTEDDLKLTEPL